MRNHFLSRFDAGILKRTIIYLIIAVSLITISIIGGGLDSPMVIMFFIGFGLFFYALLYPWQKAIYYFIQSFVLIVTFALLWIVGIDILMNLLLDEDIAWAIGFAIIAGIIGSMIGVFTLAKRGKRLLYSGTAISLLAITIMMSPAMSPPPILSYLNVLALRILIVLQIFITIMLFRIGDVGLNQSKLPKATLVIIAIVQILVATWELLALFLDPSKDFRFAFWNTQIRIIAILQIIIAFILLYALNKFSKTNET